MAHQYCNIALQYCDIACIRTPGFAVEYSLPVHYMIVSDQMTYCYWKNIYYAVHILNIFILYGIKYT